MIFPHPILTVITGKPTNSTIKLLRKEIYANARAIPSIQGGGRHGHLGMIMHELTYTNLARAEFIEPVHPGSNPQHGENATGHQITETNRVFNAQLVEFNTAHNVHAALKAQILEAVERPFLATLEDDDFGFAEVTVLTILAHLETRYCKVTVEELEENRASIRTIWSPEESMEALWIRLTEIKRVAIAGNEPLTESTIMGLTLLMFEATNVFTSACDQWRKWPEGEKSMDNFRDHFNSENDERLRKLTARQANYHSANNITLNNPPDPVNFSPASIATPHLAAAAATPSARTRIPTAHVRTNDGTNMFYCWTHGLGLNANHTSASCQMRGTGHREDATVINMQGGNNTIMSGRTPRRQSQQNRPPTLGQSSLTGRTSWPGRGPTQD